jgi:hypothetical protein
MPKLTYDKEITALLVIDPYNDLGCVNRIGALAALGMSLNLVIGLSRSPNEWAWSYIMMAGFALLFLSTHAGRVFGLDGWLTRRIEPAARAGHTWGRAWMLMT